MIWEFSGLQRAASNLGSPREVSSSPSLLKVGRESVRWEARGSVVGSPQVRSEGRSEVRSEEGDPCSFLSETACYAVQTIGDEGGTQGSSCFLAHARRSTHDGPRPWAPARAQRGLLFLASFVVFFRSLFHPRAASTVGPWVRGAAALCRPRRALCPLRGEQPSALPPQAHANGAARMWTWRSAVGGTRFGVGRPNAPNFPDHSKSVSPRISAPVPPNFVRFRAAGAHLHAKFRTALAPDLSFSWHRPKPRHSGGHLQGSTPAAKFVATQLLFVGRPAATCW